MGSSSTTESWLKANWRPVAMAMVAPGILLLVSVLAAVFATSSVVRWGWVAVALLSVMMIAGLATLLAPRVARKGSWLLVRLRFGSPLQVPLEHVEVFFFGQGPTKAGPRGELEDEDQQDQTSNVVVRIAEAATDYHHRNVEDRLGKWFEGYIVIRGTHCEPLSKEVLTRLNQRLVQCHRDLKDSQTS